MPYQPPEAWRKSHPIERAAHLFGCFYASRAREICQEEGISDHDIHAGHLLDEQRRDQRWRDQIAYGRPEYGFRSGCVGRPYMVGEFYGDYIHEYS
jgi:hypothetical protein